MKQRMKQSIAVFWITLLLTLCISDVVLGDSTTTQFLEFGYITNADTSTDIMSDSFATEKDNWDLTNFSFFDDGVYHGSTVQESSFQLPRVKSTFNDPVIILKQNLTFPNSLLLSGTSKFWIRLPIQMYDFSLPDDRVFDPDDTAFYINNTETGQSFMYSGSFLYNDPGAPLTAQTNYDINNGRVIIELNTPIYAGVEYDFTFIGVPVEDAEPIIYVAYGDIGHDKSISSHWSYEYYDTDEGKTIHDINTSVPLDLGYGFVFQEGLSSTGITGIRMNTPEDGFSTFHLNSSWNLTDTEMTYHILIPIGPDTNNETLTFDIEIYEYRVPITYNLVTRLNDVSWNETSVLISFDHNISVNDTHWAIKMYPQDNQSQTTIGIVHDTHQEEWIFFDRFSDGQAFYDFSMWYFEFRGTNFTSVPRGTRGTHEEEGGIMGFANAVSSYLKQEVEKIKPGTTGSRNSYRLTGDSITHADEEQQNNIQSDIIDDGLETLPDASYKVDNYVTPTFNTTFYGPVMAPQISLTPLPTFFEDPIDFFLGESSAIDDAINTATSVFDLDLSGVVKDMVTAVSVTLAPYFEQIATIGASIISTITKIISTIISLAEVLLSIVITLAGFMYFMVLSIFGYIITESAVLVGKGDFKGLGEMLMSIFKRGGS